MSRKNVVSTLTWTFSCDNVTANYIVYVMELGLRKHVKEKASSSGIVELRKKVREIALSLRIQNLNCVYSHELEDEIGQRTKLEMKWILPDVDRPTAQMLVNLMEIGIEDVERTSRSSTNFTEERNENVESVLESIRKQTSRHFDVVDRKLAAKTKMGHNANERLGCR